MKTLIGIWSLFSTTVLLPAQPPLPKLKIQVFVYNYAGVSAETLARAEREAARIYTLTGIETEWLDCPLTPNQAEQFPACRLPVTPTRPAVRILSRSMADRIGLSFVTFGSALLPEGGGFGMAAQVCAHCSEELAAGHEGMYAAVLGHVMAHELGHLLLGAASHSATGIMHAHWHKKELEAIAQGTLLFTSREQDKIRRQVLSRLRDQENEEREARAQ